MHGTQPNKSRRFKQILDPRLVEFLPNCRAGDLLLQGMEQHHRLGQLYHRYLFEQAKLLRHRPTESEVFLRSSDFERTFRSAESFLNGLFPPENPGEVLIINRGTTDAEILRPGNSLCKDQADIEERHRKGSDGEKVAREFWEQIKHIGEYLRLEYSISHVALISDWVATHDCVGKSLPVIITQQDIANCHKIVAHYMYDLINRNTTVYVSYMMREALRIAAQAAVQGSQLKFSLLSAHDSTVSPFLVYLANLDQARIPPFASHLLMELWQDKNKQLFVRWTFNGEELKLKHFGERVLVPYKEFVVGVGDVYNYCKELP
jgi:acid phosphatase